MSMISPALSFLWAVDTPTASKRDENSMLLLVENSCSDSESRDELVRKSAEPIVDSNLSFKGGEAEIRCEIPMRDYKD